MLHERGREGGRHKGSDRGHDIFAQSNGIFHFQFANCKRGKVIFMNLHLNLPTAVGVQRKRERLVEKRARVCMYGNR